MNKIVLKPWMYNIIPLLVWFLLLILPFISIPVNISEADHYHFLIHISISNSLLLGIFYLHTYFIYPRLKQKGLLWYLLGVMLLLSVYGLFEYFFKLQPPHNFGPPPPGDFRHLLSPVIALLCSFCYRIILNDAAREQLLKDRETVHLQTELSFLRSQVNPHFLFNTLNNLTSLARKRSGLLEPAIVNLSQLMRYMLYESDDNKVPLTQEVGYLKNYIDLQLLRFGKEVTVKTNLRETYYHCEIDPMLLIPLVENAFKYGTDRVDNNLILINLDLTDNGNQLHFKVVNYFLGRLSENEGTGIGLKNIQRRLDILYPGKHSFKSFSVGDMHTSEMTISFS